VTSVRVSLVDLYVLRGAGPTLECLTLRRAAGGRCPGERPSEAAERELREETGLVPLRLYNLSRVELFYQHRQDEVALVPVFVAFVGPEGEVALSGEHDRSEWLPVAEAGRRLAWPRERRGLEDAVALLGEGSAGPVEDVLRIC